MKKKLIAMLLTVVMIIAFLPAAVFAENVTVTTESEFVDAVNNAASGDIITLGAGFSYSSGTLYIDKELTIDFNGNTVDAGSSCLFDIGSDGKLTIKNAVIIAGCIVDDNCGEFTISDSEFTGESVLSCNYNKSTMEKVKADIDDAVMDYNYGTAVFTDMEVNSDDYAFPVEDQYDDGISTYGVPSMVINGGTFKGPYMNCCLYANCEINNATFEVGDELEIYTDCCEANIVINNSDFTCNGDSVFYLEGYGYDLNLTINGGTFKTIGSCGYPVVYGDSDDVHITLKSGTFSTDDGTHVFNDDYNFDEYTIPRGYYADPADWKENITSYLVIRPCDAAEVGITSTLYVNDAEPAENTYEFTLKDQDGNTVQTVNNSGSGITFDTLSFQEEGTFVYTITQTTKASDGLTVDSTVYTVKVVVTLADGATAYTAAVSYEKDGSAYTGELAFNNTQAPRETPAPVTPAPTPTPNPTPNPVPDIPKTGDNSVICFAALALISGAAWIGTRVFRKKEESED